MVKSWIGLHQYSTWMVVVSIVMMAMSVHPSLLGYLLVAANGGLLIMMREVARYEGASHPICLRCVLAGAAILVVVMFVILKINWLAL